MSKYFGTDGFRGEAGITLTADHAYKVGRFLGWYYNGLRERNGDTDPARIVIGKDTRRSSYMFEYSILDKFVSSLVNKCRIHNVISFRGWHSEWNRGLQVHYSFPFSFLFSVLKIGFVHFIHDAVHILRGQLSAGK